jgi:hypothetical protein
MKLNTLFSFLLLSAALGSGSAVAKPALETAQVQVTNSSLVKIRSVSYVPDDSKTLLKGRLTYSVLARDKDLGVITAQVFGPEGRLLEQQEYPLASLDDNDKSRFGGFEIPLQTERADIGQIKLSHQPD